MHPILDAFYNTDESITNIVSRLSNPDIFVEHVFAKIVNIADGKEVTPEIVALIDEAILTGHEETEFYSLFLLRAYAVLSIEYVDDHFYPDKASSLISILQTTITEKTHPILQSFSLQIRAIEKRQKGKFEESYELLKKSISLLPKEHRRYLILFMNFCSVLAADGQLNRVDPQQLEFMENKAFENNANFVFRKILDHAVNTGQIANGLHYIEKLLRHFSQQYVDICKGIRNLLDLVEDPAQALSYPEILQDKRLQSIILLMKEGNISEAKKIYDLASAEARRTSTIFIIDRYFSIHFELLKGDKGRALWNLKALQKEKRAHYLDDLFYGRIYLLQQKQEEAEEAFARLLENVKKYQAFGRLAYELQFAKELDRLFIIRLMQGQLLVKPRNDFSEFIPDFPIIEKEKDLLLGNSDSIKAVRSLIKKYAKIEAPILITGETGTGKELTAQTLHREGGHQEAPFLAINCGALSDSLLQSELFGYVAGAFTDAQKEKIGIFEAAGVGTVFLDEFGEISPKLQVTLLRVLESNEIRALGSNTTKQIKCKIIIATNADLKQAVLEKRFREDLYFRLTRFEIKLPSLRDRKEDIPLLINYFLENSKESLQQVKMLSPELAGAILKYDWPGNIRELKNELERLRILSSELTTIPLSLSDLLKDSAVQLIQEQATNQSDLKYDNSSLLSETDKKLIESMVFKTDYRFQQIQELFKKYKKLSRNQIMAITKVSPATATKDLVVLCETGFIRKVMPTKSPRTHYFEIL